MRAYATSIQGAGHDDTLAVKDVLDRLQIADFDKFKMVTKYKCPRAQVAQKMSIELKAKNFPPAVVEAVVNGMDGMSSYRKIDDDFDHIDHKKNGKSNLYKYAVWCEYDKDTDLMDVSMMCIATTFKRKSEGPATKHEIDGVKKFLEQEMCLEALQIEDSNREEGTESTPEENMVAYAKKVRNTCRTDALQLDELINQIQMKSFEKYKTVVSFKCPQGLVSQKLRSELTAKKFPLNVIDAVVEGMGDMTRYMKVDENLVVTTDNGCSNLYKYAVWCALGSDMQMDVSMLCIATNFRKTCEGPATKNEIEVLKSYLEQETCADVLQHRD